MLSPGSFLMRSSSLTDISRRARSSPIRWHRVEREGRVRHVTEYEKVVPGLDDRRLARCVRWRSGTVVKGSPHARETDAAASRLHGHRPVVRNRWRLLHEAAGG